MTTLNIEKLAKKNRGQNFPIKNGACFPDWGLSPIFFGDGSRTNKLRERLQFGQVNLVETAGFLKNQLYFLGAVLNQIQRITNFSTPDKKYYARRYYARCKEYQAVSIFLFYITQIYICFGVKLLADVSKGTSSTNGKFGSRISRSQLYSC